MDITLIPLTERAVGCAFIAHHSPGATRSPRATHSPVRN